MKEAEPLPAQRRRQWVAVATFCGLITLIGLPAIPAQLRYRLGTIKHAFWCSCCPRDDSFSTRWHAVAKVLEANVGEHVAWNGPFIELHGVCHRLMRRWTIQDPLYGVLVKREGRSLWFPVGDVRAEQVDRVAALAGLQRAVGASVPLLIAVVPDKSMTREAAGMPEVSGWSVANYQAFQRALAAAGMESLDLFDQIGQLDRFFRTDHHWNNRAAFGCYTNIETWLCSRGVHETGKVAPWLSLTTYRGEFSERPFLGSLGRRVGRCYGGLDDYELLLPPEVPDVTVEYWDGKGMRKERRGAFTQTVLWRELMDDSDETSNRYATYLGGDFAKVRITNPAGRGRILLVKDSFALPVAAFLSLTSAEVIMLDPRYGRALWSIAEEAERIRPDAVVLLYNAGMLADENMFTFTRPNIGK